jgi:sphinganine-1-phosphate aldolase
VEGYLEIADAVMNATWAIREGIEAIKGVRILGNPDMSVMAIVLDGLDIYQIGDEMAVRG